MSQVILFKEITTEEALTAIEEEASSYEGLHVEMDDPEQRKFVKGKLSQITDITKKIERARIDLATAHKNGLNNEAGAIIKRLEDASKPFTDLTDAWKIKRQKILDHKKAQEAEAQKLIDHEDSIMLNELFDLKKTKIQNRGPLYWYHAESECCGIASDEDELMRICNADGLAEPCSEVVYIKCLKLEAEANEKERLKAIEEKKESEKADREADIEHVKNILTNVKLSLMQCNLTEDQARTVTIAIKNGNIFNTTMKI